MESTIRRVAVVEDDESVRRALRRVLEAMELEPVTYASCEDFLAAGEIADFDCLVVDYSMHGLSSPALAAQLSARGHRLPRIVLTADPEGDTEPGQWSAGQALLAKPIDAEVLRRAIELAASAVPSGK